MAEAAAGALRVLRIGGAAGALLTGVVLAASMLLRLATVILSEGHTLSLLPPDIEEFTRTAHRVAATGVTLLILVCLPTCWRLRREAKRYLVVLGAIIVLTVFLALIGRWTTGYRNVAVTVGNVMGGTLLLMLFWWLREAAAVAPRRLFESTAAGALAVLLVQSGMGAALSAYALRGQHVMDIAHPAMALLVTMLGLAAAWNQRHSQALSGLAFALALLLLIQVGVGVYLVWLPDRPTALAWLHGMLAPLLAVMLMSLAVRGAGESGGARIQKSSGNLA